MLCRWQTSSYRVACLRSLANHFVNVSKRKQSVSRVEITRLLAVPVLEPVLELEVVVPVGPMGGITELDPGSAERALFYHYQLDRSS